MEKKYFEITKDGGIYRMFPFHLSCGCVGKAERTWGAKSPCEYSVIHMWACEKHPMKTSWFPRFYEVGIDLRREGIIVHQGDIPPTFLESEGWSYRKFKLPESSVISRF